MKQETEDRNLSKKNSKFRLRISKIKRRSLKHVWLLRIFLIIGIIVGIYGFLHFSGRLVEKSGADYYAEILGDFLRTPDDKIIQENGRTNLLLMGKGGFGHEAPDLTDTIIFVSVEHETNKVTFVSLPRDIWIPELRAKLNSVYYWGNRREDSSGLELTKKTVSGILQQPIHYAVVVDFTAFKDIIDILGGIEVEVENSFVDEKYPIPGKENDLCGGDPEYKCRYETIRFEQGRRLMDGETALKFVRSRNAEGDEGTDFARAARQQKVIAAVKDRVISTDVLLSREKVNALISTGQEHIETDLDMSAAAILTRRGLEARGVIDSHVLPEEFLENPIPSAKYDNLYVLIPLNENWSNVREWIKGLLE